VAEGEENNDTGTYEKEVLLMASQSITLETGQEGGEIRVQTARKP